MLDIQHNVPLTSLNTLAIAASARYFADITTADQIPEAVDFAQQRQLPMIVLGGGSNIVFNNNYPGLVIKISLCGVVFSPASDSQQIHVTAQAGESWSKLVETCLARQYYGLENLSLIPGTVGAAPIQNIGAYGVELNQCFESLTGWDCETRCWVTLNRADCEFAYRDSVFKHRLKDRFIISSVTLRLTTIASVNTGYGALQAALSAQGVNVHRQQPSPEQVAAAVVRVRRSKLPDPAVIPNAGSFFKNPTIDAQQFVRLKARYPDIVSYAQADGRVKLAAGWLLEQAGWKGKQEGGVGMHCDQALVMVNHNGATGEQVVAMARRIQQDISARFDVDLVIEPAIY